MRDVIVMGERCGDVADELLEMDIDFHADGSATFDGPMNPTGPLLRAIFRAEAELLLADADAMVEGRFVWRTPDQRRADAFVLVAERLTEAVNRVTTTVATGDHPRGRKESNQRRRSA